MKLRNASIFRPVLAVLAVTMLVVALACASEDPRAYQSSSHVSTAHVGAGGRRSTDGDAGAADGN